MSKAPLSRLRVESYSGYRADEEPRRFYIGERVVTVDTILDRWLAPNHSYFKVQGGDGGTYILRHNLSDDSWELILYDSGRHADHRHSSAWSE